jgi:GT2 family glycosyltransferase
VLEELYDVGCIVIHHKNFPDVVATMTMIIESGVPAENLVLVDNSEDEELASKLRAALAAKAHFLGVPNLGYGAALNAGVAFLSAFGVDVDFVLVATHEVIPEQSAIPYLREAMLRNPRLAVAGPTVIDGNAPDRYWSLGGTLSRILRLPAHVGAGVSVSNATTSLDEQERAWLDGSFCLYRAEMLKQFPAREDFFLYFEETELHSRIHAAGGRISWVPRAVVSQSSGGIPPYLLGRNLQLFQRAHGTRIGAMFAVPHLLAKELVKAVVRRQGLSRFRGILRGWLSTSPFRPPARSRD